MQVSLYTFISLVPGAVGALGVTDDRSVRGPHLSFTIKRSRRVSLSKMKV